jgi:hypothetical protein
MKKQVKEPGKASMTNANPLLIHCCIGNMCLECAFAHASVVTELYRKDKRVAQLLVLLRQLNDCSGGLAALPKSELVEIISSAVGICGFLNPLEAHDVIATVLDALEIRDPIPESRMYFSFFSSSLT